MVELLAISTMITSEQARGAKYAVIEIYDLMETQTMAICDQRHHYTATDLTNSLHFWEKNWRRTGVNLERFQSHSKMFQTVLHIRWSAVVSMRGRISSIIPT